jgi:hypothetical protein
MPPQLHHSHSISGAFTYQHDRGSSRLAILPLLAGVLAVPVSVGIAILRHGLFDVGLVIRRSLLYGALSLVLWGLYAGGAALLGTPRSSDCPWSWLSC